MIFTLTNAAGNDTDCNGLGSAELDGRPRSVPAFHRSMVAGIAAILSDGRGVFAPRHDTTTKAATIKRQQPTAAVNTSLRRRDRRWDRISSSRLMQTGQFAA
jgi:hypothetical protein